MYGSFPPTEFLLSFVQTSKAVILASCINVEMLVTLCRQAITYKKYMRRFEAATPLPMSGYAIESPLHAASIVQCPICRVQSHLYLRNGVV